MSEPESTVSRSRPIPSTGVIYAGLFALKSLNFHWAIIIPSGNGAGTTFEAIDHEAVWSYYHRETQNLYTSRQICVFVNLGGSVTEDITVDDIHQLLSPIPMSIPAIDINREKRFSCRVWFREAVRILDEYGIVSCPDVDAFEKRAIRLGLAQMPETFLGNGYDVHDA